MSKCCNKSNSSNAGDLKLVKFYSNKQVNIDGFDYNKVQTLGTLYKAITCRVKTKKGWEMIDGISGKPLTEIIITCPYAATKDINTSYTIMINNINHKILNIENVNYQNKEIKMTCVIEENI